ncbi:hypothetical protein [Streptomyces sp. SAS_275]|uniref:hypothetical protein n=1 Tax=Streptomyces sp. SAS_275 TaxID=3412746 RepID=UPI00403D17AC
MPEDAYDNLTTLPRSLPGALQERSIFLSFEDEHNDTFRVRAYGSALPYDGNAEFSGILKHSRTDIATSLATLHDRWLKTVVQREHAHRMYTYEDLPDKTLGPAEARHALDQVVKGLALAGERLYRLLFHGDDDGLKRLEKALTQALRSGPQTITVTSPSLFVPWGMLYVHPDPGTRLLQTSTAAQWPGFLGYTHLIEHCLGYVPDYTPFINHGSARPNASLHFDLRLQRPEEQADLCPVRPVRSIVETHAEANEYPTKEETAEALTEPDCDSHILVFGAHGTGQRPGRREAEPAKVVLSDDEPIYATDIQHWASDRTQRLPDPLCFMMVCEGGRAGMFLQEGLARPLFNLGVGCLIGPQIEVNTAFGSRFTTRFFEEFFKGECAAPVVRQLTQEYILQHATPLGLAFTLVRGIDTCLVTETEAHATRQHPSRPDRHGHRGTAPPPRQPQTDSP